MYADSNETTYIEIIHKQGHRDIHHFSDVALTILLFTYSPIST